MKSINLMYHDVFVQNSNESGFPSEIYKTDLVSFEKQIQLVSEFIEKGVDIKLTFDDGGSSFYNPIAEILDKYKIKGIFFIATKFIGNKGFLSKDQIRELEDRGHIIGSHSHTHPDNISILSKNDIFKEWFESNEILTEIIGHSVKIASIPNGYESENVIEMAHKAGIQHLYTSRPTTRLYSYNSMNIYGRYVILSSTGLNSVKDIITKPAVRYMFYMRYLVLFTIKSILGTYYDSLKKKVFK